MNDKIATPSVEKTFQWKEGLALAHKFARSTVIDARTAHNEYVLSNPSVQEDGFMPYKSPRKVDPADPAIQDLEQWYMQFLLRRNMVLSPSGQSVPS